MNILHRFLLIFFACHGNGLVLETDKESLTVPHVFPDFGPKKDADGSYTEPTYDLQLCDLDTDLTQFVGKIAFIERGDCLLARKVYLAHKKGAVAAIIYNPNQPGQNDATIRMQANTEADAQAVTIPSAFISYNSYMDVRKLLYHVDTDDLVHVYLNDTGSAEPVGIDPSSLFLKSVLFMLQLLIIVWSIVAIVYFVNWVKSRHARRKRLYVVRRLPTRRFKPSIELDNLTIVDEQEEDDFAPVHPSGDFQAIKNTEEFDEEGSTGASAVPLSPRHHPRHTGHHQIPIADEEVHLAPIDIEAQDLPKEPTTPSSETPITDYFECDSCVICLCNFEAEELLTVLPCGHGYHKECIEPWLIHKSALCPMCKQSILPSGDARPLDELPPEGEEQTGESVGRSVFVLVGGIIAITIATAMLYVFKID